MIPRSRAAILPLVPTQQRNQKYRLPNLPFHVVTEDCHTMLAATNIRGLLCVYRYHVGQRILIQTSA
jgi:hypothetical protein